MLEAGHDVAIPSWPRWEPREVEGGSGRRVQDLASGCADARAWRSEIDVEDGGIGRKVGVAGACVGNACEVEWYVRVSGGTKG